MLITDFTKDKFGDFISNDVFYFKNNIVDFYYKWKINAFTYQPGWNDDWNTKYIVSILIDKDSRHENHQNTDYIVEDRLYCFDAQIKEIKHKKLNDKDLEKIIKGIDKIKIENKIKKNNYEQIKAILNGNNLKVF